MKAVLSYTNKKDSVILLSGSLSEVDHFTSTFYNYDDLIMDNNCWSSIKTISDGEVYDEDFHLMILDVNGIRSEVPILFNDNAPIFTKNNFYENEISEIESARRLLFSSKNSYFLSEFLLDDEISETIFFTLPLAEEEANFIRKKNIDISVLSFDERLEVLAVDVLKYALTHKKLGGLRFLFEDAIDIWADRLYEKGNDEIYLYCRNLRILKKKYITYVNEKNIENLNEMQKNLKKY